MSADKSETVGKVKTYHNPCHETHGHHLVENEGSGWVSLHDYRQLERKLAAAHEKIARMGELAAEAIVTALKE